MQHHIIIQQSKSQYFVPKKTALQAWAKIALQSCRTPIEMTMRIVGIKEMTALNEAYRHKQGATNVLSFPSDVSFDVDVMPHPLGDIVICAKVVNEEAKEQEKSKEAHWAHMVVHGVLHLLGYDHEEKKAAQKMEKLEIKIMQQLGFGNPYAE